MQPDTYLDILAVAAKLKTTPRHCFTQPGRAESVADHSWRLALMAMLLQGEEAFAGFDLDRVIRMCLIHDLGEAFTGDIPAFLKNGNDEKAEDDLYGDWVSGFPQPQRGQWQALLAEMNAQQTPEAKLYKALDKLEAVISHNESELSTWLPLEYDLQFTHGAENVRFSPWLTRLKEQIDAQTRAKIQTEGARDDERRKGQ